ncbi:hypothetical protein OIM93_03650 [Clostridium chauvoei]|uniref:hypothetical protein n=1 Tax=Clostridium chauvoei TaxID=46867 RepID=UPI002079E34D|nr:hypothetical protein [Clostridium chauvoei]
MKKNIISFLLSGVLVMSLVSCTNKADKKVEEPKTKTQVEEKKIEGEWAKNYSKEEVTKYNNEILTKIEELTQIFELEYEKKEVVKEENGETVNSNYIYIDNLNPEPNRLESMDYRFKIYGSDMSKGQLVLRIGFNLDKKTIKEDGSFDFKETSIASYSEAMTGVEDRDYTELNKQIYDIVNSDKSEGTIENNLNGLLETISIKDNILLYKLETKKYDFKK